MDVSTRLSQFMAKPFQAISVVPEVLLLCCVCSYPALVSYAFSHMGYFCQVPVLFSDDETFSCTFSSNKPSSRFMISQV
jgi:hypothetical protein